MLYIKGPNFSLPFPLALRYSVVAILLFTWHGVGAPTPFPRIVLIVHPFPSLLKRHGAIYGGFIFYPLLVLQHFARSSLRCQPYPFPVEMSLCDTVRGLGFCSPRWEVASFRHGSSVSSSDSFSGLNISRCS